MRPRWLQPAIALALLAAGCQVRVQEPEVARPSAPAHPAAPTLAEPAPPPTPVAAPAPEDRLPAGVVDRLVLGEEDSEAKHELVSAGSEVVRGGLDQPARRLLPRDPASWQGGRVAFRMKVSPDQPNYVTLRLWGSDITDTRLLLYVEGLQIGYRHLGDVDILDEGNGSPSCGGRFFYTTTPLPTNLTAGRSSLAMEIRSNGRIWGYGTTFDQYQHPMTMPSRGLYALYTHTAACLDPPSAEVQGRRPRPAPIRPSPGPEILEELKARVNREIKGRLQQEGPWNQHQLWFMARAYHVKWTEAYHQAALVEKAVESLDALHAAYCANPSLAFSDPVTPNADWFGLGMAGQAIVLLREPLAPYLDRPRPDAPAGPTRRRSWTEALVDCRDRHRAHRRSYTNQSMINDTYGIYLANRGVAALSPAQALPELSARRYLYESAGLEPWRGSEKDGVPEKPLGDRYFLLTPKALTKELGYVGYYGEVLDWMTVMYQATAPAPGQPGDARLLDQLVRIAKARAIFRYPELDNDGFQAMRIETVIGWRDQGHYPGDVTYAQRNSWDGSALECVAATLDPALLGAARQMLADHQFFASLQDKMANRGFRVTAALLDIPDHYEKVCQAADSRTRLPMTDGQPDFVWSDEENGVVAVKHGDEMFYASLYWRARYALNFLARVHLIQPAYDRLAVVRQQTEFEDSGLRYERPDWINFGFGNGGPGYPEILHSAHAGEVLPIARLPPGLAFKPGQEHVLAGRGDFYTLDYGPYLVAMNCAARARTGWPAPRAGVRLPRGERVEVGERLDLEPFSTVVIRKFEATGQHP